jgi:hypothetical protein
MSGKFLPSKASQAAFITTQPYVWYGEGSIAEENWIWAQEALAGYGSSHKQVKAGA